MTTTATQNAVVRPAPADQSGTGGRVAVLGPGTMGAAMARSLVRAGLPIDVWNRTPQRAAPLAALGASAHAGPAQSAAGAGVAITARLPRWRSWRRSMRATTARRTSRFAGR
jgi:predicted dinucleotide-binding enzyme